MALVSVVRLLTTGRVFSVYASVNRLITFAGLVFICARASGDGAKYGAGHLKRFGEGRPIENVEERDGFLDTQTFFRNYVLASKPIVMRGAAKLSPAFSLWNDDYFLSLKIPADNTINVETRKKENRTQPTVEMHFKDFVKIYNKTDQYMVDSVPPFLRGDIVIPGPLQCEEVYKDKIVQAMMWFSSGGTKSVVHTDSVDNINCLYRGRKELVMVDPHKYKDKVDIDHPEGAYSGVDVDRVDYSKYPGLAEVEFLHVKMEPGDCLFIPYKWIHQVRSYGSNLAVNIWWDFFKNKDVDLDKCTQPFDPSLRLSRITFLGFETMSSDINSVKDQFSDLIRHRSITFEKLEQIFLGEINFDPDKHGQAFKIPMQEIFRLVDRDRDGAITKTEVEETQDSDWELILKNMKNLEILIEALEGEPDQESDESHDSSAVYPQPRPAENGRPHARHIDEL